uniref:Clp R domain-containing protein n=1 Tax=Aegilops tauschii TaxID=37682 RepID=M8C552_AEGTA
MGRRVVAEVTRVLETHRAGRVWVMGGSATYETYLTFLSKFPLLDKDWELQLLPLTQCAPEAAPLRSSLRQPPPRLSPSLQVYFKELCSFDNFKLSYLIHKVDDLFHQYCFGLTFFIRSLFMDSLIPFGGLVSDTYEANSLTANSCPPALRCQQCNDRYEQEVATIIRGSGITAEDHHQGGLPSLLQNGSMIGANNGFDAVKVRDQMVLNSKISNLQKKWNEYCLRLHQGCHRINSVPYQLFPHYIGVPANGERAENLSKGSESVELQREVIRPSVVSVPHTNATTKSISPPSISNLRNDNLTLELQAGFSKSDEKQSRHETLSYCHDREDHVSPSSAASVATDLVLGTPHESSSKGTNSASCKHVADAEISVPKKVDDLNLKPPQIFAQPFACSKSSTNMGQTSPSAGHSAASGGLSAFGHWQKPSHLGAQGSDLSNYKLLVERLFQVVGRQEEALSAICGSIVRCKSMERRHGPNKKNDMWFSFHGSDCMAKRRVALALAELVHGSKENMIYLDLSLKDWADSSYRGKTGTDYIVDELSKKRRSVIFLDNVDKADCLLQDTLTHASKTGRFRDLRGKEVDINDSIVVLSTRTTRGSKSVSVGVEEGLTFTEDKILAASGHQLKILVESCTAIMSEGHGDKVIFSPGHPLAKIRASLYCGGSVSKRKFNISDDQEKLQGESPSISKRLHRTSSVPFDLNLPIDEDGSSDADDHSGSNDNSYGTPERSMDSLLCLVDESIDFKPFDFDKVADYVLQELSNTLRKVLGSGCTLEIDVGAMEQIVAAAWASEGKRPLQAWLDQVFAGSLGELKVKCGKHASSSTLILVACEDMAAVREDNGFGGLLPSRIILEW